jgi:hypothetical protein
MGMRIVSREEFEEEWPTFELIDLEEWYYETLKRAGLSNVKPVLITSMIHEESNDQKTNL